LTSFAGETREEGTLFAIGLRWRRVFTGHVIENGQVERGRGVDLLADSCAGKWAEAV
jgi:hypothetical protein